MTGEPPYGELDLERMSRALATGDAWGVWISTREAQHAFAIPFFSKEPLDRLKLIERGCMYFFEFATGGKLGPTDVPKFQTMKWLDFPHTLKLLRRTRELEFMQGKGQVPTAQEITAYCEACEKSRFDSIPEVRKFLGLSVGV